MNKQKTQWNLENNEIWQKSLSAVVKNFYSFLRVNLGIVIIQ